MEFEAYCDDASMNRQHGKAKAATLEEAFGGCIVRRVASESMAPHLYAGIRT